MQFVSDSAGREEDRYLREILDALRHIVQMMRTASAQAEAAVGLTAAQLFVLQVLARDSCLSVNDLAARTLTHQSSVSVVVSRLVEKRLVSKTVSTRDRRQAELRLTKAGQRLLERAPSPAQDRLIEALSGLPAADRQQLASLLGRVVHQSDTEGPVPRMFFESDPVAQPPDED